MRYSKVGPGMRHPKVRVRHLILATRLLDLAGAGHAPFLFLTFFAQDFTSFLATWNYLLASSYNLFVPPCILGQCIDSFLSRQGIGHEIRMLGL
jgi:hypothetical protein